MVKSCNALLRMLLVCIRSYLKSALSYKFLIFFFTHHLDTPNLHEVVCMDLWLFFKARICLRAKEFGKHCYE